MLPSPLDVLADWIVVGIQLFGGVSTVMLAAVLAYLVRDTHTERRDAAETHERQTELQERQTRLLAANHEPVVRRGEWEERAPDLLALELTNEGAGVARDLRLAVDLDASNDAYEVCEESVPLYRLADDDDALDTQAADLRAGETAMFVAPLAVGLEATGAFSDSTAPFSAAVEKLRYTGTQGAAVDVAVTYDNVLGESSRRNVLSGTFTLVEGLDFPAAMRLRTDDYLGDPADRDESFSPFRLLSGDATVRPEATVSYFTAPGRRPSEYVLRVGVDLSNADLVKFTRGERVVASVDATTDEPVAICGGEADEPPIEHGGLLHVYAISGGNEVEIDCFAAPDAVPLPPRLHRAGVSPHPERSAPVEASSSATAEEPIDGEGDASAAESDADGAEEVDTDDEVDGGDTDDTDDAADADDGTDETSDTSDAAGRDDAADDSDRGTAVESESDASEPDAADGSEADPHPEPTDD